MNPYTPVHRSTRATPDKHYTAAATGAPRCSGTEVFRILSERSEDGTMNPLRLFANPILPPNIGLGCPSMGGDVGRDVGGADTTCLMDWSSSR